MFRSVMFIAVLLCAGAAAYSQTKLLRFPDIYGEKVVFTYGGDLWTAPSSGGSAIRLTSHPGIEVFGKFSPDGKWIAFTGQYDGDEQVYVVSSGGGVPRQLTFYPAKGPLTPRWGWTTRCTVGPATASESFLSLSGIRGPCQSRAFIGSQLTAVRLKRCPCLRRVQAIFRPDSSQMAYSPQSRDFRPRNVTEVGKPMRSTYLISKPTPPNESPKGHARQGIQSGLATRYISNSDRDGHFNLYAYSISSGTTTEITNNKVWDVRWPSSDNEGRIVYELNGELEVLDVKSRKSNPISITVPNEGLASRPSRVSAANQIESVGLSPKASAHCSLRVATSSRPQSKRVQPAI